MGNVSSVNPRNILFKVVNKSLVRHVEKKGIVSQYVASAACVKEQDVFTADAH